MPWRNFQCACEAYTLFTRLATCNLDSEKDTLVWDIFILVRNILITIKPSRVLRHLWYHFFTTIMAACFRFLSLGPHCCKIPILTFKFCMMKRFLAFISHACCLSVSCDWVWSQVVVIDAGVRTCQTLTMAARHHLGKKGKMASMPTEYTYWLAPRFTSFCQYSMVRDLLMGSLERFSK